MEWSGRKPTELSVKGRNRHTRRHRVRALLFRDSYEPNFTDCVFLLQGELFFLSPPVKRRQMAREREEDLNKDKEDKEGKENKDKEGKEKAQEVS